MPTSSVGPGFLLRIPASGSTGENLTTSLSAHITLWLPLTSAWSPGPLAWYLKLQEAGP